MPEPQNFKNHNKLVPLFHLVAAPILVINLVWSISVAIHARSTASIISLLLAVALILIFFFTRTFALVVQDRVIRLETQLRLQRILPADLQPRVSDLTLDQLVALRFASDAELPGLVRKVLADNIRDRKTIKQMIREWQPDNLRA